MDDLAEVAALRARVKELEDAAFDMECAKNAEIGRLNERMAELQFERSLMPVREMLTQTPYSRRLLDPSQERAGGPAAETSSISQASARSADACASQLLVHDGGGEHGTATGDTSMADDGPAKRSDPYLRGLGEMQVLVATMQRAITAQQSFREAQLVNTGKGSAGESEEADGGKVRALLIEVAMLAEEKAGLADKLTAAEGKARAIAEQWNAAADAARERIEALEASVAELAKANADLQHARPHPSQAPDGNHGQLQDMAAPPNTPEPRGSSVASPVANCLSSPPNGAAMLTPSNSPAPAGDCLRQQQLRQQQQEKEEKEDQLAALTAAVAEKQEELRSAHASIGAVREAAERLQREQEEEAGCRLQQQQLQQQQREKEAAADEEMEGGVRAEQQQQQQQQQQEELQEKYVGALQRLAEAEKQVAEQVDAVSALHGERDELHREVNEAAQRYEELQRAVEAKEQELTGELSRTREAAAQAAEADAATKEALRAQAAALQAALDGTSAKHAALDAELAGVLQQCEAESKRANALTGEIAGVKALAEAEKHGAQQLQEQLRLLERESEEKAREVSVLTSDLLSATEALAAAEAAVREKESDLARATTKIAEFEHICADQKRDLEERIFSLNKKSEEGMMAKHKAAEELLKAEIDQLKEELKARSPPPRDNGRQGPEALDTSMAVSKRRKRSREPEFRVSTCDPRIALSAFKSRDEKRAVHQAVDTLGGRIIEMSTDMFDTQCTHMIIPNHEARTVKTLAAVLTGRWVMTKQWVTESVKAGRWLPEDAFGYQLCHTGLRGVKVYMTPAFCQHSPERVKQAKQLVQYGEGTMAASQSDAQVILRTSQEDEVPIFSNTWEAFIAWLFPTDWRPAAALAR